MLHLLFIFLFCISVVSSDYYDTLGITRSASQLEIKNAYRRLAKKWYVHYIFSFSVGTQIKTRVKKLIRSLWKLMRPMRLLDFCIIHVIQVLSNTQKRHEYDTFGTVHEDGSPPPPGRFPNRYHFMHSPFEELFNFFPGFHKATDFSEHVIVRGMNLSTDV